MIIIVAQLVLIKKILNLIKNSKLRIIAANVGIKKIYSNHQNAMLTFNDNLTDEVYKKIFL